MNFYFLIKCIFTPTAQIPFPMRERERGERERKQEPPEGGLIGKGDQGSGLECASQKAYNSSTTKLDYAKPSI